MTDTTSAYQQDQKFFRVMAIAIAAFILFAFAQFALRGFANYATAPVWVHLHGLAFTSWLVLLVAQNLLAERGSLALHRRLGWLGCGLALAMVFIGIFATAKAVELHRVPPFFTDAYFLALGPVDMLSFALLLAAAIGHRRDTQWHRRLMIAATVVLMEPAFGRLLPMPFMGMGGPLGERALQLAVLAIGMHHDVRVTGAIHPAWFRGVAVVVLAQVVISGLAAYAPFVAYAGHLAGN